MIIDIIVLAVLFISALIAFLRGFIRETLTIVGVVGATAAAFAGGPILAPLIRSWLGVTPGSTKKLFDVLPYPLVADILAYGGTFVIVLITLSILSHFISEGAKKIGLGPVDRTFGVIFGLVRGVVLIGLLYLPVYLLVDQSQKERWFADSNTHFYMEKTAAWMAQYLPNSAVAQMEQNVGNVQRTNNTRKTLQQMDILGGGEPVQPVETAPQTDPRNGYTEDFRNDMDRLFEQKTGGNVNE